MEVACTVLLPIDQEQVRKLLQFLEKEGMVENKTFILDETKIETLPKVLMVVEQFPKKNT